MNATDLQQCIETAPRLVDELDNTRTKEARACAFVMYLAGGVSCHDEEFASRITKVLDAESDHDRRVAEVLQRGYAQ